MSSYCDEGKGATTWNCLFVETKRNDKVREIN